MTGLAHHETEMRAAALRLGAALNAAVFNRQPTASLALSALVLHCKPHPLDQQEAEAEAWVRGELARRAEQGDQTARDTLSAIGGQL